MIRKLKSLTISALLAVLCTQAAWADDVTGDEVRIGIAWRSDTLSEFYTNTVRAIREAGGTPVLLEQVVPKGYQLESTRLAACYTDAQGVLLQPYAEEVKRLPVEDSNVAAAVGTVCAVVFTGGEDISPTLLRVPELWHGIEAELDYNATRDVSDYLTLAYCLDQDLPVMGMCRGMQMLSVVSGASIIQDIPTFFRKRGIAYELLHRNAAAPGAYRDYAPHGVSVMSHDSHLYRIARTDSITGAPSWHHQCVGCVSGTPLAVTGRTLTQGISLIEAVERTDKTFCIGLQFHPEAAIVKHLQGAADAERFMNYDEALRYFTALVRQARSIKKASL